MVQRYGTRAGRRIVDLPDLTLDDLPDITAAELDTDIPPLGFAVPVNLGVAASVGSNALTIALKGANGSDPSATNPVLIPFRSATAATGTPVWRSLTSATSIVISSGSTLGTLSGSIAFAVWLVAFDDAGTLRLGVIQCRSGSTINGLSDYAIASSTAEGGGGAADTAQTFYTATAVSAKAYAILARLSWESGLATAGTWASGPTRIGLWYPGMPLPGQPTGNIAQVVKTDTFTGTAVETWTDITGMTYDFLYTSAANAVLAKVNLNCTAGAGNLFGIRFNLDAVAQRVGDAASSRNRGSVSGIRTSEGLSLQSLSAQTLLFANRAAPTASTLKLQFWLQGDTFYVNRTPTDTNISTVLRTASDLTLQEIMV
jgi:hypothetical protein